jgi:hypothetical protein
MNDIRICTLSLLAFLALSTACSTAQPTVPGSDKTGPSGDKLVVEQSAPEPREATIAAVHERNRPRIRECFQSENGAVEGSAEGAAGDQGTAVEVELHLPSSGTPASIRLLEPETVAEPLQICLEQALSDFEYGEANSGSTYYQWLTYDANNEVVTFSEPIDAYQRWGLTADEIESVVADHEPQIDGCYDQATEAPKGRVLLTLVIGDQGQISRVGIKKSTLGSETVEDCVVEKAFDWEFPPPRGGGVVVFDVALVFEPGQGWVNESPKN